MKRPTTREWSKTWFQRLQMAGAAAVNLDGRLWRAAFRIWDGRPASAGARVSRYVRNYPEKSRCRWCGIDVTEAHERSMGLFCPAETSPAGLHSFPMAEK